MGLKVCRPHQTNEAFRDGANVEAVELLQVAAKTVGGGAGGTSLIANAGGRDADRLPQAIRDAYATTRELLALG